MLARLRQLELRNELGVLAAIVVLLPLIVTRQPPLGVYTLGLVGGGALALQAVGLILVFRSNRFVNFAQVQIGVVAATLFTTLVHAGALVRGVQRVCPPCIDRVTTTVANLNYAASLVVSMGVAVGLGWLAYVLIFRRLDSAPRLVLTVATIFLSQALGAAANAIPGLLSTRAQRDAGLAIRGAAPLPFDHPVHIGRVVLHASDWLLMVSAVAAIAAVSLLLSRTSLGTRIRAASESPARAETLGVDVRRVTARVWMMAGALSGLAALLTATTAGTGGGSIGGTPIPLLVRILAVAVVARFVNLPLAGAAAAVIGVVDAGLFFSFNTTDVVDGVLLVVIAVLLLVQRRDGSRAGRDDPAAWQAAREARPVPAVLRALPVVRSWARWGTGALVVAVLAFPWLASPSQAGLGASVVLAGIVAMSLLVLTGWAGQVSLGQFAFAAIGAYVAAASRLPFLLALPAGAVAGAAVAVVVGLPALKLRGLNLAITTLAFALATSSLLLNPRYLGRYLPARLASPTLAGIALSDPRVAFYVAVSVLAAVVLSVMSMRRSRTARALVAARDNEVTAQAFGINLVVARLGAFAVSGFLAALSGGLLAFEQGGVRPISFSAEESVRIFTFTVIGGIGSIAGPLLGVVWLGVLTLSTATPLVVSLAGGAGGLILLLFVPGGISQLVFSMRDAALRRLARRRRIEVPSLTRSGLQEAIATRAPIAPRGAPVTARYDLDDQWGLPVGSTGG